MKKLLGSEKRLLTGERRIFLGNIGGGFYMATSGNELLSYRIFPICK